jgi:hypothetical protein
MLEHAGLRWRRAGISEQVIRERWGVSGTRFWQVVNGLLDRPDALAAQPMTVRRLRALREGRRLTRSSHAIG